MNDDDDKGNQLKNFENMNIDEEKKVETQMQQQQQQEVQEIEVEVEAEEPLNQDCHFRNEMINRGEQCLTSNYYINSKCTPQKDEKTGMEWFKWPYHNSIMKDGGLVTDEYEAEKQSKIKKILNYRSELEHIDVVTKEFQKDYLLTTDDSYTYSTTI